MLDDRRDATDALTAHAKGDRQAASELLPLVYDRLRALAGDYMRREKAAVTLQPTALVHEAYLRLININRMDWQGKTHFFALAATQMRRLLVEHARASQTQKRAGQRVTLDERVGISGQDPVEVLAVDEALERLARNSARQARVAELRVFAGLGVEEVANVLGVSPRTVKQDWRVAKAWLRCELADDRGEGAEP